MRNCKLSNKDFNAYMKIIFSVSNLLEHINKYTFRMKVYKGCIKTAKVTKFSTKILGCAFNLSMHFSKKKKWLASS